MTTSSRSHPECIVVDSADDVFRSDDSVSLFYTMLPLVLRRSVPKVRSLRRSISNYSTASPHRTRASSSSESESSGIRTPPPPYIDPLAPFSSEQDVASEDDSTVFTGLYAVPASEEEHGACVRWKYAGQGLSLLTLSVQDSTSRNATTPFGRQLYIHSLTYLLRGLPTTLTKEEQLSLQAALPMELIRPRSDERTVVPDVESDDRSNSSTLDQEPTILHRLISMSTLQLFVLISIILPYVQTFVQGAYQYEREHHISERVFTNTVCTADSMGRKTWALSRTVCALNGGKVGEMLEDASAWCIQGISGGLYEGVGEGMEVLGLKSESRPLRRRRRNVRA